jgi:hypothetical protein
MQSVLLEEQHFSFLVISIDLKLPDGSPDKSTGIIFPHCADRFLNENNPMNKMEIFIKIKKSNRGFFFNIIYT